jgi:hypothetical protein
MNKLICSYNKRKGTFKRVNCEMCSYSSRCIDYMEHTQGNNDELRDLTNLKEE